MVVLPAPFGPSSPNSSPRSTEKLTPRNASTTAARRRKAPVRERYLRVSSSTSITVTRGKYGNAEAPLNRDRGSVGRYAFCDFT